MTANSTQLVKWIDDRLASIFRAPKMYGQTDESIIMQVITLLELREFTLNTDAKPWSILNKYLSAAKDSGFPIYTMEELQEFANRMKQ